MTQKKILAKNSSEAHSCRGSFSTNARNKLNLIFLIVRRDISQLHRQGLPLLLVLSALLLATGVSFFIIANSGAGFGGQLDLTGHPWTVPSIGFGGGRSGIPLISLSLLQMVYGYSTVVNMILILAAFSINYSSEVKKGTIRTLTCYPIGVFEITVAKLTYAAIVGFVFATPVFMLPVIGLEKSVIDLFAVFVTAYAFSLVTVAAGVFAANALTVATRKMYIQPPVLATLFVVLSFFATSTILNLLGGLLSFASPFFQAVSQLTPLSLFHEGRLLLTFAFGGSESPLWLIFLVPTILLVLCVWATLKLWPDIYEKE